MMAVTPFRIFLFSAGALAAGTATAYIMGAFDPYVSTTPSAVATLPQDNQVSGGASSPADKAARLEQSVPGKDAEIDMPATGQETVPDAGAPETVETTGAGDIVIPSFDVVRVEPDGSIVIAGRAAADSQIEIIHGATVLGLTKSGPSGDFAVVLSDPLKPGDYQLVLRETTPDKAVATSLETALVTIPESESGQVLALVDKPGEPSRLITVPEAVPAETEVPQSTEKKGESDSAATPEAPQAVEEKQAGEAETPSVAQAAEGEPAQKAQKQSAPKKEDAAPFIEAVEIDGREVFVAGTAEPGRRVRVYANDILLGETQTDPNGRFLIESVRDLPVGDYIVRADVLGDGDASVIARVAVPFSRSEGEKVAAVAPNSMSDQQADSAGTAVSGAGNQVAARSDNAPEGRELDTSNQDGLPQATAPALESVEGSVIIRRGDTLWHISRRVYGRGIRYSTIYLANQSQIRDPDRIWPGQVFTLPETSEEGEPADLSELGDQIVKPEGGQ